MDTSTAPATAAIASPARCEIIAHCICLYFRFNLIDTAAALAYNPSFRKDGRTSS